VLQSGDNVEVSIVLKNTSNKTLRNIVYAEKVEDLFRLEKNSVESNDEDTNIRFDVSKVGFVVENITLSPGATITITYTAKTRSMNFGHLQVGLFE
jgi:hypothetical protein